MKSLKLLLTMTVAITIATACTKTEEFEYANLVAEKTIAQTKWETSKIQDYKFHFYKSIDNSYLLMSVIVDDGRILEVRDLISEENIFMSASSANTIDGLFSYIGNVLSTLENNSEISIKNIDITYDKTLGFPTEISYEFTDLNGDQFLSKDVIMTVANFQDLGE